MKNTRNRLEHISFNNFLEMRNYLIEFNNAYYGKKVLNYCYIVFTEDSFKEKYSEIERTYCFSSDNKIFRTNCCSTSLFADCMDGKEKGIRLDWYMYGNKKNWKIKECWIAVEKCFE